MSLQFSTKFHFKWTFYVKLILGKSLDAKDWFHNKDLVQCKITFQMSFLWNVNYV